MKHNITVRIGAPYWDVTITAGKDADKVELNFDLSKLTNKERHEFRRELVKAWGAAR